MRIKVRGTGEGAAVDIITPGVAGPESDQIVQTVNVSEGNELLLNMPLIEGPAGIEYGNVVSASGEPAPPAPPVEGGVGGGNEGSADQPPAPGGDGGAPNTGAEGEGGGAPATGDQGGSGTPDTPPPTTSAASEKPLYLVDGDTVPAGYTESGLETPDGKTLFHYGLDLAGGPTTGNADGVSVYAESADNEKPVVAAAPAGTVVS